MRAEHCSSVAVLISQLMLMTTLHVIDMSPSAAAREILTAARSQSSSSDTFTSSRHKRAPGWGKRAPGWGKRNDAIEDFSDYSESALENMKNSPASGTATFFTQDVPFSIEKKAPGWGKRAPGWGKRAPGWGKRAPGWGKRSCFDGTCTNSLESVANKIFRPVGDKFDDIELSDKTDMDKIVPILFKRAPGWGKRNYVADLENEEANDLIWHANGGIETELYEDTDNVRDLLNRVVSLSRATVLPEDTISTVRRAPGWGKRNHQIEMSYEGTETDKRAPGWGKRAPGWGKRAPGWGKRAPGWGKRAPGWGKRNDQREFDDESAETEKRAPGWGKRNDQRELDDESEDTEKRAPGWGKRAPGWGKRSVRDDCQELQILKGEYVDKVVELVSEKCGNMRVANKTSRK